MITCKEDLMNTWIKNDNGELTKLYLDNCSRFGILTKGGNAEATMETFMHMENIGICKDDGSITWSNFWNYDLNGCKQLTLEDLKPQTKEVEWVNGDKCQHENGIIYTFIGECDNPKKFNCVLMDSSGNTLLSFINELSKPETEEQRKERERLEAAYDLYCDLAYVNGATSFESFKTDNKLVKFWLAIVDKTNYRVEGE